MNIKEAKEQIKNAMTAYFTRDEFGEYIVPVEKQRPVFLMGPPGIGKTMIMEQIAAEMGVGLLSYSMTHHTRQSALGLPVIEHRSYQDMEYDVSVYTMSEIIASVYDLMEQTGIREGILFLDEINCVSETLAPTMLQFLQFKTFGRHKVPDGWIVVTAGNPPEYNHSAREFDIVTRDRLKRIDIEPDFEVWKEYAIGRGVHPAVRTYLEIKKSDFYKVETTVDGKTFVTARGWDDLSQMLGLYDRHGLRADGNLIGQYLQNPRIAKEFGVYYELFCKYKSDYQVDRILNGDAEASIYDRVKDADFDERLSLLGLLTDAISSEVRIVTEKDARDRELFATLKEYKMLQTRLKETPAQVYDRLITSAQDKLDAGKKAGSLARPAQKRLAEKIRILREQSQMIAGENDAGRAFVRIKADFERIVQMTKIEAASVSKKLENLFAFCEAAFGEGQEMLILVTEMTADENMAKFIGKYGSEAYFRHNKELLVYERQKEIDAELETMEL